MLIGLRQSAFKKKFSELFLMVSISYFFCLFHLDQSKTFFVFFTQTKVNETQVKDEKLPDIHYL